MAVDLVRILLLLLASRLVLAGVCIFHERQAPRPEVSRKLLHLAMGALAIAYPWIFRVEWPVIVLSGVHVLALAASSWIEPLRRRVGPVVRGVERVSVGEFLFPLVIALLFILARNEPVLYVVPVLLMTVSDAAAALVGTHFGKHRYHVVGQCKSLEGSAAFLISAMLLTAPALLVGTALPVTSCVLLALLIALSTTLAESVCTHGLDNIAVPLAALTVASLYL